MNNNRKKIFQNKINNESIEAFSFEKVTIPTPAITLSTDKSLIVNYGGDNKYPFHILDLYQKCPIHQTIINNKNSYLGNVKNKDSEVIVNDKENFDEFIKKIKLSYLLFNFYAVEVVFNAMNEAIEFYFLEPQNIRLNQNKDKIFYNSNGFYRGGDTIVYDRYFAKINDDSKSKVFYFEGYFPNPNLVYPNLEYASSITSIMTDIAIRTFDINNVSTNFSATTMISFFNGDSISREQKDEVKRNMKKQFTGESGNKLFINFNRDDAKPPEIQQLTSNDWANAYELLSKKVNSDIFIGHGFNRILLNNSEGNSLGNSSEMKISYEIFKCNYIDEKRSELVGSLKNLFFGSSINCDFEFIDNPLFNDDLSEQTKIQVLTINELRKLAGFNEIENGNRLINDVVNEEKNTFTKEYTDEEFDSIFNEFELQNIGVSKSYFSEIDDKINFADDEKVTYVTMYDYVKRDGISGATIIKNSRNFCKRLIALDRYFSREDIVKMSEIVGFDVFKHSGGWFKKDNKCRHEWKEIKLKKNK